jgi:predicted nucleic acid-binding protein
VPAFFFDASGLAKCYIHEVGSNWVRGILAPALANDIHVLGVSEVEVTSAIVRRRKAATISPSAAAAALIQLQHDFASDYIVLDVSDQLLAAAILLVQNHELRAYDGIQLAAATELNRVRIAGGLPSMTLVSADQELNSAAAAEGIAVEDPNTHP